MAEIRKVWVKRSPCRGCLLLDSDTVFVAGEDGEEIVGAPVEYCTLITNTPLFFQHLYGEVLSNGHKFRNCSHRRYHT